MPPLWSVAYQTPSTNRPRCSKTTSVASDLPSQRSGTRRMPRARVARRGDGDAELLADVDVPEVVLRELARRPFEAHHRRRARRAKPRHPAIEPRLVPRRTPPPAHAAAAPASAARAPPRATALPRRCVAPISDLQADLRSAAISADGWWREPTWGASCKLACGSRDGVWHRSRSPLRSHRSPLRSRGGGARADSAEARADSAEVVETRPLGGRRSDHAGEACVAVETSNAEPISRDRLSVRGASEAYRWLSCRCS